MEFKHTPIMLNEVISGLNIKKDGIYVDCTVGGGGHSYEIARHLTTGKLYAFDRDEEAIVASKNRLKEFKCVEYFKANFKNAPEILKEHGVEKVDGVLIDLGVSSHQIDDENRGFSFLHNGKLDMRMGQDEDVITAYDVVNTYSEEKLKEIFYKYGEEEFSKVIARNIVKARKEKKIETTFELRDIIEASLPKKVVYSRGGASKKVFQAIRIEVNKELTGLDKVLSDFIDMLSLSGRFAVLTFHSLEDRIVKEVFKRESTNCLCPPKTPICICHHKAKIKLVNRKPIMASEEERKENSRSTSAKLRIAERI